MVDVQWTQRKNVRPAELPAPGTVLVKRSATVRVRAMPPRGGQGREDLDPSVG
jgi:hypothetical protein